MPYVDEPCQMCAGRGWKQCPGCSGHGVIRCFQKCDYGKIPCPVGCDHGYDRVGKCDYCHGTLVDDRGMRCMACNQTGHMRCGTCNPFRLGGGLFNDPGYLRCPAECNAGYIPCPCTLLKWGSGKTDCDACVTTPGVVAVWHNDPVLATVPDMPTASPGDSLADRDASAWAAQKAQADALAVAEATRVAELAEADRLRNAEWQAADLREKVRQEILLAEESDRRRQDQLHADEDEQRRQDQIITDRLEVERQERLRAEEDERRRQEIAEQQRLADAAEDERRRNEGNA